LSGGRENDTGPSRRRSLLCVEWKRDRYQATKNKPLHGAEHLVKRLSHQKFPSGLRDAGIENCSINTEMLSYL
jgi:hypothetical protein